MNKLLFAIAIVLLSCGSSPRTIPDTKVIIGIPIKINNIEIAQFDFPDEMNWVDSKKVCESLGEGWRLPTLDELHLIYENMDKIEGLTHSTYWSSTDATILFDAWCHNFINGQQSTTIFNKYKDQFGVRAVRTK
jgi:hypothetical protein